MSVDKRKKISVGDTVWVAPYFWNYPGGWLEAVIFSNDDPKYYDLFFPIWDEFCKIPKSHPLKDESHFDYTRKEWKIGDKVQVNNSNDPIWWEAVIAQDYEDGDTDILIEWIDPGLFHHEQTIVPLDSIRSAQNQSDLN